MENLDINALLQTFWNTVAEWLPQIAGAIIALIIGLWIVGFATKLIRKALEKQNVDPTAIPYATSVINVLLKIAVFIMVASILGIEATSFVAIIGAAGLAIGLALQGSLANFASGFLILVFKPYKVGDVIETSGQTGVVKEIQIFNTILNTLDKRLVIVPNSKITSDILTNFSTEPMRLLVHTYGIGYGDNIDQARSVIQEVIDNDPRILKDPAPQILVSELADSSVNFSVRMACNGSDYWPLNFSMYENIKKKFDERGINIPFPQHDVHIVSQPAN